MWRRWSLLRRARANRLQSSRMNLANQLQPRLSGFRQLSAPTPDHGHDPFGAGLIEQDIAHTGFGPLRCHHAWKKSDSQTSGHQPHHEIDLRTEDGDIGLDV